MKKTYILTSLIAIVAFATTTGTFEFFSQTSKKIKKDFKVNEIGLKSEVKVKDTGLTVGSTFKGKNIVLPLNMYKGKVEQKNGEKEGEKYLSDTFFNNSNIFIKYDLPEMKNINSYLKASINPKVKK